MESLFVPLRIQFHPAKVVVGKRVVRGKFYSVLQHIAGRLKFAFGPSKKSEIAIGIFEEWIETYGFLRLGGSLGNFAHSDEQDAANVTNARVIRVLALRSAEFDERILQAILL